MFYLEMFYIESSSYLRVSGQFLIIINGIYLNIAYRLRVLLPDMVGNDKAYVQK